MKMKNIPIVKFVLFFHQKLTSTVKWIKQLLLESVFVKNTVKKNVPINYIDNRVTGKRLKCSL